MLKILWVLHECHSNPSTHMGAIRTIQFIERFSLWIRLDQCVSSWIRRRVICEVRKTSRQTVRWPALSIPLPNGPREFEPWDYFAPLSITESDNKCMSLITDRLSRHAVMSAVSKSSYTVEGTANSFGYKYKRKWGIPRRLLSDSGQEF